MSTKWANINNRGWRREARATEPTDNPPTSHRPRRGRTDITKKSSGWFAPFGDGDFLGYCPWVSSLRDSTHGYLYSPASRTISSTRKGPAEEGELRQPLSRSRPDARPGPTGANLMVNDYTRRMTARPFRGAHRRRGGVPAARFVCRGARASRVLCPASRRARFWESH
jgi:hypothetical protein